MAFNDPIEFPGGNPVRYPEQGQTPTPLNTGGSTQAGFGTTFKPWETIDPSYSMEQWQAWEPSRDPNCPAQTPYRAERKDASGNPITTCVEKPVDCPPGTTAFGDDKCLPTNDPRVSGGGGGGGGKGGGGGALGGGAMPFDPAGGFSGDIMGSIAEILAGKTRFSPEVMADLEGKAKLDEQARVKAQTQTLREQQAARGVFGSAAGAAQETDIRGAAADSFDASVREFRIQKAMTDMQDKLAALGLGLQWINSLRNYSLGLDSNNVQREQIAAGLTLGRERIQSEMAMLMEQINANADLAGIQIEHSEWQTLQQMILCLNTGNC